MTATTTKQAGRVVWVDVAKGACILLVVLFHATNFAVTRGYGSDWWVAANALLQPIRMPLFFLASGFFAAGILARPWNEVWRRRIVLMLYLYGLWVVLRFAYFSAVPGASLTHEEEHPLRLLTGILVPHNGLWFVYALAIYFAAAKLLNDLDVRVQLGIAFLVSWLAYAQDLLPWTWQNMAAYFLFFLIGVRGRDFLTVLARHASLGLVAVLALAYSGMYYLSLQGGLAATALGSILLTLLGLAVGILAAASITWGPAARALAYLGTVTLPIYLMHEIAMGTLAYLALDNGLVPSASTVQAWGPIVITAAGVAGALLLHRALLAARANWLFGLPGWLQAPAPARPGPRQDPGVPSWNEIIAPVR
ncbi:acyltransferase family protein [Lolliginicoccus suaedae]|uniref:acyltransferase family protein n=1 Tax=Lolliginicoccus suaedae TaxID=2605429 RepID=UPI0016595A18|nr:acyltransferase family protein [Lolliginicoccus suaedae]